MSEKKQKIFAREYFNGSKLFRVDVMSGMDNSATSSTAEYELTCKKCDKTFTRKGNARNLNQCAGCKRVWNRAENTITEPEPKVKAGKVAEEEKVPLRRSARVAKKVEEEEEVALVPVRVKKATKKVVEPEPEEESDSEDEVPIVKRPPHDIDLLAQILKGDVEPHEALPQPKKKVLKDGEYWVETILDYYDDYEDRRWYRFYLVKWHEDPKPTFIRSDKFTEPKMVDDFEKSIPTTERFKNMFPNPKISKKTGKETVGYRTKEEAEKELEEDTVEEPVRHKVELEIVYLKAGHRYFDRKSGTLFLLDGDKDLDQILFNMI